MNDDLEVPMITPRRPANPPPQPPIRKQSHELLEETVHAPRKPLDRIRSQSKDHTVETGLSRKSALNDRYFEDGRSRSLDNLLESVSFLFNKKLLTEQVSEFTVSQKVSLSFLLFSAYTFQFS